MNQYSELTIKVTKSLSKNEKKEFGIFITPRVIIESLLKSISEYSIKSQIEIKRI